jgi:hypothetical protein
MVQAALRGKLVGPTPRDGSQLIGPYERRNSDARTQPIMSLEHFSAPVRIELRK